MSVQLGLKQVFEKSVFNNFIFVVKCKKMFILSSKYQVENLTKFAHLLG